MTVDTLSLAQQLRAAELSPTQAEAIATAIGRSVSEGSATRADLEQVRTSLKAEIEQTKLELKAEIERSRNQLLLWFISTQVALGALVVAVAKL